MADIETLSIALNKLIADYGAPRDQLADLLGGSADGGPNGDGKYPITLTNGATVLVPSPKRIAALSGDASSAVAAIQPILDAAQAARDRAVDAARSAENAAASPYASPAEAACVNEAGLAPVPIAVRASSWAKWGLALPPDRVAPGAVLVFQRPGGGHVGFYVGENARSYRVLGGNQGDCVSEAWIAKDRCVAIRWPEGRPIAGSPVILAAARGDRDSTNEA